MSEELYHHGVKGMKWGIRRNRKSSSTKTSKEKSDQIQKTDQMMTKRKKAQLVEDKKKKSISELSDAELKERIGRLELEKRYKDLAASSQPQISAGRKLVDRVIEKSAENISTQLTTYMFGTAVNKTFGQLFNDPALVNPKKGQKDK